MGWWRLGGFTNGQSRVNCHSVLADRLNRLCPFHPISGRKIMNPIGLSARQFKLLEQPNPAVSANGAREVLKAALEVSTRTVGLAATLTQVANWLAETAETRPDSDLRLVKTAPHTLD
jgi:hypothetical protein